MRFIFVSIGLASSLPTARLRRNLGVAVLFFSYQDIAAEIASFRMPVQMALLEPP